MVGFENCDDNNTNTLDGCSDGYIDPGYICKYSPSVCVPCGNGILDALFETCDDGQPNDGIGCSSDC